MRVLKNKKESESHTELAQVIEDIAESAENNFQKVKDQLSKLKTDEGELNQRKLWKLKKKLCPNIFI